MRSKIILFILFVCPIVWISSCTSEKQSQSLEVKNCFNDKNFSQLKEYIKSTINTSGMGKFYLEYPPDKTQIKDGIKRPSKHPENVYDVYYNETLQKIIFENKNAEFSFHHEAGYVSKKNQTKKEENMANNIYCYILSVSDGK